MGYTNFISLHVVGSYKDVTAFNAIALGLPVLSDYIIERDGEPVTTPLYEDMVFEKPRRWHKHWWCSWYVFDRKDKESAVDVVREVSKNFHDLCFRLDWDWEHEEFGSHLIHRGKVESVQFDADSRREELFQELTGGADDYDEDVCFEIDNRVVDEFQQSFKNLWEPRIHRILTDRRQRQARGKDAEGRSAEAPARGKRNRKRGTG